MNNVLNISILLFHTSLKNVEKNNLKIYLNTFIRTRKSGLN